MTAAAVAPPVERPVEPVRSRRFTGPLVAALGVALLGAVLGGGPLWGTAIGAAVYTGLRLAAVRPGTVGAVAIVAAGAAAGWWFTVTMEERSGAVGLLLAARASLGWLVLGAAVGVVTMRARPATNGSLPFVAAIAAWAGGTGVAAAGTAFGVLAELDSGDVARGALQVLGVPYHAVVGIGVVGFTLAVVFGFAARSGLLAGLAGAGLFTVAAYNQVGFSVAEILGETTRIQELAREFWPPVWSWPKTIGAAPSNVILEPMIETVQIAIIGATVGCLLAIPLAFFASRPTAPGPPTFWGAKWALSVLRTIPDLFWAALFASAVGFGALAGALAMVMFSLVIMAKLFSETIDSIDPGPIEAVRTSGARYTQVIQYGAFPQVLPTYIAYALYIFELNIRASVVIGVVGAGGIGRLLDEQRTFFQWDRVMAIVLVIFVAVIVIELFSIWVRRRLL